jgi:hypothetical protein
VPFYSLKNPKMHISKNEINWDLAFVAIIMAVAGLILWRFAGQTLGYLGFRRV